MPTALRNKIQKLRKEKGFTLDQLAARAASSKSYIWELENKDLPRPSADKLSKIATALDVTIEYLLDHEQKITEANATDDMFFRKYQQMDPDVKKKIRKMIELWEDED
jgi:transcriptional regulator with XRE-family HTH domain